MRQDRNPNRRTVSLKPPFDWPDYPLTEEYDLCLWEARQRPPSSPLMSILTESGFQAGKSDPALASGTQYSWYYKAYDTVFTKRTLKFTGPTYTFWTNK